MHEQVNGSSQRLNAAREAPRLARQPSHPVSCQCSVWLNHLAPSSISRVSGCATRSTLAHINQAVGVRATTEARWKGSSAAVSKKLSQRSRTYSLSSDGQAAKFSRFPLCHNSVSAQIAGWPSLVYNRRAPENGQGISGLSRILILTIAGNLQP